jgi:hypothetical protein
MDEDALVEALNSGQVSSVGLDVYQKEPNIHAGLVSNPHVCLLPHMGTSTVEVSPPLIPRRRTSFLLGSGAWLTISVSRPRPKWRNGRLPMSARPWRRAF